MRKTFHKTRFSSVVLCTGRYVALAIAIVCLLGVPIHGLIERHTYCALHGELSHDTVDGTVLNAAARQTPGPVGTASVSQSPLDSGAHDEHCSFSYQRRESFSLPVRISTVVSPADIKSTALAPLSLPSLSSIPLLAFAPKNSPPVL